MKKLIITALLIILIALCAFAVQEITDTEPTEVAWTIEPWVTFTITSSVYVFGEIEPGADEAEAIGVNLITIDTNADWSIDYEVEGEWSDCLEVELSDDFGTGWTEVSISYMLSDLRYMEPGDHGLTVTFTVVVG